MTLRKNLTICFSALSALMLGLGISSLRSIDRLSRELDESQNLTTQKIIKFGSIRSELLSARLAVQTCLYFGGARQAEFADCSRTLPEHTASAESQIRDLRPMLVTEKGKAIVAQLSTAIADYKSDAAEVVRLAGAGQTAQAESVAVNRLTPTANGVLKLIDGFMQVQSDYVRNASAISAASTSTAFIPSRCC